VSTCITITRIVMDEVEFASFYNSAVTAAEKITAPETKNAMMLVLQLISALREQVAELQLEEDE